MSLGLGAKTLLLIIVVSATALWISYRAVPSCKGEFLSPGYSPNGRFYYQMYVSTCAVSEDTRPRLMLGKAGEDGRATLLDFNPPVGSVQIQWRGDSELRVTLRETSIAKRFDLPPEWMQEAPRIIIESPTD